MTVRPASVSSAVAARPARPAPTTMASASSVMTGGYGNPASLNPLLLLLLCRPIDAGEPGPVVFPSLPPGARVGARLIQRGLRLVPAPVALLIRPGGELRPWPSPGPLPSRGKISTPPT